MKKIVIILVVGVIIASCGTGAGSDVEPTTSGEVKKDNASENPTYDPKRGEGKFTNVEVEDKLDAAMAATGEKVYGVKCSSCHKTTDERLVGPGWKDVTKRHTAAWIMNFSTNPDVMLNKDPQAQAMLELCLVRMPNQNLADTEARELYEFMRKNDGVK